MASVRLGSSLRQIHGLFEVGTVAGLTDGQLLDRYLTRRDESAFAALVMRHGPMVLGVCHAVLRGSPEVEDAFQATFLVLIRKATTIRGRDAVGGWLHRVAHRVAVQAGRDRSRKDLREHLAGDLCDDIAAVGGSPADDEWRGTLHEELARLPERFRQPVVLCYLEGKTHEQAALELRWSEATLRRRLADARGLLRSRLSRRGVAVSVAALAAAIESPAMAAVPPAWVDALARVAAGQIGAAPAAAAAAARLAGRTIRGLVAGRVRTVANVVAMLLATGLLAGHLIPAGPARADDPARSKMPAASRPAAALRAQQPDAKAGPEEKLTIRGRVVDPDGRPFAGARVYAYVPDPRSGDSFFAPAPRPDAITGADGRFEFAIPDPGFPKGHVQARWEAPRVAALARGFGPAWSAVASADDARDLTLKLIKDDVAINGRIVNLEGRPVAGVTVRPVILSASENGDLSAWEAAVAKTKTIYDRPGLHHTLVPDLELFRWINDFTATSDADGRFRMTGIGRERVVSLWIEGPTIASDFVHHLARTRPGPTYTVAVEKTKPEYGTIVYHGSTFEHAAAQTRPIEGTVRDKDTGQPLAGISIRSERFAGNPISGRDHVRTTTGADGRYRLVGMPTGAGNQITVHPDPGQPYLGSISDLSDEPGTGPINCDFELKHGVAIKGKVTDKATGEAVPAVVEYFIFDDNPHRGEARPLHGEEIRTRADGSFDLIGLPGRGLIAARALRDLYLIGQGADKIAGADKNGLFRTGPHACETERFHAIVAIEPAEDARSLDCDVALDPGVKRSGIVVGPDGQPVSGCKAVNLYPHTISFNDVTLTSETFTATALDPGHPRPLFFRHEGKKLAGLMMARGDESGPITVRLQPAGTVTGRLLDDHGDPRHDVRIDIRHAEGQFGPRYFYPFLEAPLGTDGRFRIEGMIPGVTYDLDAIAANRLLGDLATGVKLQPGETRDLGDVKVKRSQ